VGANRTAVDDLYAVMLAKKKPRALDPASVLSSATTACKSSDAEIRRLILASLMIVAAPACERGDDLRCGDGTVERDGECVVDGSEGGAGEASGSQSGVTNPASGGDWDESGEEGGDEGAPGTCIGQARPCHEFEGTDACLGQNGCYPNTACVGQEADCTSFGFASPECDASPHCYSEIKMVDGTMLPGCWPYSISCAQEYSDCEAYGGTCRETMVCDGEPDPCEFGYDPGECEEQQGCYWQT
jgi:hypothetical protein